LNFEVGINLSTLKKRTKWQIWVILGFSDFFPDLFVRVFSWIVFFFFQVFVWKFWLPREGGFMNAQDLKKTIFLVHHPFDCEPEEARLPEYADLIAVRCRAPRECRRKQDTQQGCASVENRGLSVVARVLQLLQRWSRNGLKSRDTHTHALGNRDSATANWGAAHYWKLKNPDM
jgi:hypothetical protein